MQGKLVKLKDNIAGFKAVLAGEYDNLPEQAFYMVGDIKEVIEKAKQIALQSGTASADDKAAEQAKKAASQTKRRRPAADILVYAKQLAAKMEAGEVKRAADADKPGIRERWATWEKNATDEARRLEEFEKKMDAAGK